VDAASAGLVHPNVDGHPGIAAGGQEPAATEGLAHDPAAIVEWDLVSTRVGAYAGRSPASSNRGGRQ